jgi:hypothetical protein
MKAIPLIEPFAWIPQVLENIPEGLHSYPQ